MPIVSVIVVCYNDKPERIRETLGSIVVQDYPQIEIVVIDGGSAENTLRAFDEFRAGISVFVSEPDHGIYDAMNKGVLLSRGEWINFMNVGDSFFSPSSLSGLLAGVDSRYDIVYGDYYYHGRGFICSPHRPSGYLFYSNRICHQALLSRHSLFAPDEAGLFDLNYRLGADHDWMHRAFKRGANFKHMPIVVCNYAGDGASSNGKLRTQEALLRRQRNFSLSERCFYAVLFFCDKIVRRVTTGNFRLPVALSKCRRKSP